MEWWYSYNILSPNIGFLNVMILGRTSSPKTFFKVLLSVLLLFFCNFKIGDYSVTDFCRLCRIKSVYLSFRV